MLSLSRISVKIIKRKVKFQPYLPHVDLKVQIHNICYRIGIMHKEQKIMVYKNKNYI